MFCFSCQQFQSPQTASDYWYHTFGEWARFIYCLLQKIKQGISLPLVEQWDEYVLANLLKCPSIADGEFLAGTRVLATLNKVGSSYLKKEFQRDERRFLEEFTNSVLSTVAACYRIGQGLSCFCPAVIIGGDDHALVHLLGLLLDGLLERGWVKGSDIEASRVEYQSFVQGQRQLERSSTRSRPDVGDVLSFCSLQADFRARQHFYKICIVTKNGRALWLLESEINRSVFPGVPTNSFYCARASDFRRKVYHQSGSRDDLWRWSAWCSVCWHDFVRSAHFTQRNFFSDSGISMLAESAAISDSITNSGVFEPWSHVETASRSQVVAEVCACVNQAVDWRRAVKDSQEQWYAVGGIRPSLENSASRSGDRITNVVEEGRVEYVPVRAPSISFPGPSNLRVSSEKSKQRKISRSPVERRFEIASPPASSQQHRVIEDLGFSAALNRQQFCKKSRRSGRNRRAAPVVPGAIAISARFQLWKLLYILLFAAICRYLQYEICLFPVVYIDIYVVE